MLFPSPSRLLIAAAAAVALCGCGRQGDLEPPPSANAVQTPGQSQGLGGHKNPPIAPPKKAFVLDPLLQ